VAHERDIEGATRAEAYLLALEYLLAQPRGTAIHLAVRIADPTVDSAEVTGLVDALLIERRLRPVSTVTNTLFPASYARRFPDPVALGAHYRRHYERIRRLNNNSDTYFGRLVAYPVLGADPVDQLSQLVDKLRNARASARPMTSQYEVTTEVPGVAVVYSPARDRRKPRGFPCLSLLSFHIGGGQLHLAAHYRNHAFVARAYGNYVALAELLTYIARATDWEVGELLVVSGHAQIEAAGARRIHALVADARAILAAATDQPEEVT
jgi:hypothetical protein